MLRKKSTSRDNKRKHSQSDEQNVERKRTEPIVEDFKDELADPELDKVGSDIEEGGLDLSVPFKPISAYVTDRQEMLEQCFHVLGEKKLKKMLPDDLKSCTVDEIKKLCQEQLELLSQTSLLQILAGEELTASSGGEDEGKTAVCESQQDNIVDSTSSLKESGETGEDSKQEDAGSGEESDVLSINADTYDSDIEGHKDKQADPKPEEATEIAEQVATAASDPAPASVPSNPEPGTDKPIEAKKELEKDIDKSVNEILALGSTSRQEDGKGLVEAPPPKAPEAPVPVVSLPAQGAAVPGPAPAVRQPSVQQLELLELEMRARAIKALMKANEVKKTA